MSEPEDSDAEAPEGPPSPHGDGETGNPAKPEPSPEEPRRPRCMTALAALAALALLGPFFVPSGWAEVTFGSPPTWLGPRAETAYHALIFMAAGLALGVFRLRSLARRLSLREATRLVSLLALVGALVEGVQAFVPQRSASWGDVAANASGALLGVAASWVIGRATQSESPAQS